MAKVFIEETTLTAIGDAIRGKEGSSALIPVPDMAARISAIEGGGSGGGGSDIGLTAEDFTFKGSLEAFNSGGSFDKIFEKTRDLLSFVDITSIDDAFSGSSFEFGDIVVNLAGEKVTANNSVGMGRPFYNYKGKALPKLSGKWGPLIGMNQNFFGYLPNITDFDGVFDEVDWSILDEKLQSSTYNCVRDVCMNNSRMRKAPPSSVLKHWDSTNTWGNIYAYSFDYCYALDELADLPVFNNKFCRIYLSLNAASRLKRFTFETNSDGSPIVVTNWAYNSVIDLSKSGFGNYFNFVDNYKLINSDASYAEYKDHPDACPTKYEYSRYNKASAIETINSLPDASGITGYTHTIKFKGEAGSSTDGGAINTLTEAEIAVAAAKGWTVSMV